MALTILAEPKIQLLDNTGAPLAGGKVYTYESGTTTPKETYTDSTGASANANPVVLDSAGRANIWLSGTYKIAVKTAADVEVYTVDNVSDVGSFVDATSEWKPSNMIPTYISGTSFSVPGDVTATLTLARRLRLTCTAGTIYGTVTASSFSSGITTVTVINDSGSLDSGLSEFDYGIFNYSNPTFRKVPILDHGTKSDNYTLNMALADVHIIAFSASKTLTIASALTNDKSTIIIKNGNNTVTLAGIDNNSPTLTVAASKQDFITLAKSFGKITCISQVLNEATV